MRIAYYRSADREPAFALSVNAD